MEELENDFIENDDDTYELALDSAEERRIISEPKDLSIRELMTLKAEGNLDLQPSYQREYVYDSNKTKPSRLIESILIDVPIPVIYLAEERNCSYSVIDGQQRLTTFISFVDGKFPNGEEFKLSGLKILPELNKKRFSDLSKELQNKIRGTTLHSIIIRRESNEDIKFEIFERLNTGSIKLNEDEIRNSVYRGKYIDLLKDLADSSDFHFLVNNENARKRMIYRGMILRFLALSEKSYLNYKPSIKQFCNKELRENRNLSNEKAKEYKGRFFKSVELCKLAFGENAFRRFKMGDKENPNGKYTATKINMALYDIEMCGFAMFDKNQIIAHLDEIREGLLNLQTNNDEFIRAIELQTSDKEQVIKRFQIWLDFLHNVVSNKQNRIFPYSIKKQLFSSDSTCKLCNNQILCIDDAEVDHIVPFAQGGKTIIENAQIAHRYCNRKKGDKQT